MKNEDEVVEMEISTGSCSIINIKCSHCGGIYSISAAGDVKCCPGCGREL